MQFQGPITQERYVMIRDTEKKQYLKNNIT